MFSNERYAWQNGQDNQFSDQIIPVGNFTNVKQRLSSDLNDLKIAKCINKSTPLCYNVILFLLL